MQLFLNCFVSYGGNHYLDSLFYCSRLHTTLGIILHWVNVNLTAYVLEICTTDVDF